MDAAGYIADRLDDQIGWYDRKSLSNQNWYKGLRMLQVLAAALIPFLTAYLPPDKSTTQLLVGLLGVAIAVVTATLSSCRDSHFQGKQQLGRACAAAQEGRTIMAKRKVFISFDYDNDRHYKNLLVAWDKNDHFDFSFYDGSVTAPVNSQDAGPVRRVISQRILRVHVSSASLAPRPISVIGSLGRSTRLLNSIAS